MKSLVKTSSFFAVCFVCGQMCSSCSRNVTSSQSSSRLPAPALSNIAAHPTETSEVKASQALGIKLARALQKEKHLAGGAGISIGTSRGNISLDGHVANAAAKTLAFQIVKKEAPGHKISNRLVIVAPEQKHAPAK